MKSGKRNPPRSLALMQVQFGKSIRTPFSFSTGRFECRKDAYPDWADEAIRTRKTHTGRDRLSVYNEQYWYRLLTVLQQDFPLLSVTMGLWEFNQLASSYLDRRPSRSPFLQNLAKGLVEFMKSDPVSQDPRLVQIAAMETAFLNAFLAPSVPPLVPARLPPRELEMLAGAPLFFQPWLTLLKEDWNLMEARADLAEKRIETPAFLDRKGYWAVFRNGNDVEWNELDPDQFKLLFRLRSGQTLESACEAIAEDWDIPEQESLMARIPIWFENWTRLKWFGQPSFETLKE